jgi:hypothetical protein
MMTAIGTKLPSRPSAREVRLAHQIGHAAISTNQDGRMVCLGLAEV